LFQLCFVRPPPPAHAYPLSLHDALPICRRPADGEPRTGMGVEVALADRRHRAAGGEHDRPAGLAGRRTCSEGVGEVDPGRLERGARAAETALVDLHRGEVPVDATEADDVVAEGPDGVLDTEGDGMGAAQYVDGAARAGA